MRCPKCGHENEKGRTQCKKCGKDIRGFFSLESRYKNWPEDWAHGPTGFFGGMKTKKMKFYSVFVGSLLTLLVVWPALSLIAWVAKIDIKNILGGQTAITLSFFLLWSWLVMLYGMFFMEKKKYNMIKTTCLILAFIAVPLFLSVCIGNVAFQELGGRYPALLTLILLTVILWLGYSTVQIFKQSGK